MNYLLNGSEMKQIDEYTINALGIPSLVLMERAALETTQIIRNTIPKSANIIVVCGSGNNGGDGIAIARMLHLKGYNIEVFFAGDETKASDETKKQLKIIRNLGLTEYNSNVDFNHIDVIIDAIFGIGLSKPVTGRYHEIITAINESKGTVYAVDIPSGINCNNGKVMGCAVKADYTVTFGYNKIGLVLYPGADYAGKVSVVDIGFPGQAAGHVAPKVVALELADLSGLPQRHDYSNKGTYGKTLVIAGSKNMSGACYFSAKAAYYAGTGLVKILTAEENRIILGSALPEAILETYDSKALNQEALEKTIAWASVIVLGPGIGISDAARTLVKVTLSISKVPVIIDADALNILAGDMQPLRERTCPVILTPHIKEMSRLTGRETGYITENLIEVCASLSRNEDLICVLKDARTVITDADGKTYINLSGNNGMATGGSGDVLTGIIAGLISAGTAAGSLFKMVALGVFLHGLAGDEACLVKGEYALIASDIIDYLPLAEHYKCTK